MLDLLIVGTGPAGVSAALTAFVPLVWQPAAQ